MILQWSSGVLRFATSFAAVWYLGCKSEGHRSNALSQCSRIWSSDRNLLCFITCLKKSLTQPKGKVKQFYFLVYKAINVSAYKNPFEIHGSPVER